MASKSGQQEQNGPRVKKRVQLNVSVQEDSKSSSDQRQEPRLSGDDQSASKKYPMASKFAGNQRLMAPRLSLLGRPIDCSSHRPHYRNTRSLRLKMRVRAFLEQPDHCLAWSYHGSL